MKRYILKIIRAFALGYSNLGKQIIENFVSFSSDYGYYMYIETSAPRQPNDTARLISPTIAGNGTSLTRCVKFYYHMYGPHVNTLRVYTRSNGKYNPTLWMRNATQGPAWRYGEVQVKTADTFSVSGVSYRKNNIFPCRRFNLFFFSIWVKVKV